MDLPFDWDPNCGYDAESVTPGRVNIDIEYTLTYRAGTGGTLDGIATQTVAAGGNGTPVSAVIADAGAVFHAWSDGVTDQSCTDTNVQADLDVTANFRSTGGSDLDWYAAKGIVPEPGETWADVDARPVPAKGTTLREENLADTDPADPSDRFEILAVDLDAPVTITFRPASTKRTYTLLSTDDLNSSSWTIVPGTAPRPGQGEGPDRQDSLTDPNTRPARLFYRIKVDLP